MLRLFTFLSALFLATAAAATTLWVDAPRDGYLNLRTGPSTQYHIVGQMPHGSTVEVLHTPGKWYKVRHQSGAMGWAHSAFLSSHPVRQGHDRDHAQPYKPPFGAPGGHYGSNPTGPDYWVHAPGYSGLNLREGPGSHYRVLMTMGQRDRVVELGRQGSWILVRHDSGRIGWAHGDYLSRQNPGHVHGHSGHWDNRGTNGGWDHDRQTDLDSHKGNKARALARAVEACSGIYGEAFNRCVMRKLAHIQ